MHGQPNRSGTKHPAITKRFSMTNHNVSQTSIFLDSTEGTFGVRESELFLALERHHLLNDSISLDEQYLNWYTYYDDRIETVTCPVLSHRRRARTGSGM